MRIIYIDYHTGLKNFPEYMLFDYKKDYHMLNNLVDKYPDVVNRGIKLLEQWHKEIMKSSTSRIDPMWTVIREGGPSHTRGELNKYLRRLKKTGRDEMIQVIKEKNETYE